LDQKRKCPSAIERSQSLDNVVPADDRLVIRSGEFVDSPGPKFVAVGELIFPESGDSLQLGNYWRRKNLLEDRLQFGDAGVEHSQQALAVDAQRLESHFLTGGESGDVLRIGMSAPELEVGFEGPEQGAHGLAHGGDQVGGAGIQVGFRAQEGLRQTVASRDRGYSEGDFSASAAGFLAPDFLSQKVIAELAGEGELRGIGFFDPLAVKGASHG